MDAYPREAWQRLGQHLRQRRPQLDARYRIRKVFAEENGLTDKTVQEIENAYRETFSDVMLSTIERAYRIKPGSIERFLSGQGDLEPAEPVVRVSQPALHVADPPRPGVQIEQLDENHLQVGLTIETEPDLTLAEVEARLEAIAPLSPNERAMIANMEALELPPAEIGGTILMVRGFSARGVGQHESRPRRRA